MARVEVKINPKTHEYTISVDGVQGGKCTDITAALIANNQHVDTQYTSEYCAPEELPDYITDMNPSNDTE